MSLNNVNSPKEIKRLDTKELEQLCCEIRDYIIECCSSNPGHIGSSLGAVELSVALHYVFDTPKDKIIWDVGHQAYAHKIITGRREAFKQNRKYKGLSGFPKMAESEYDAFGTGHSSTSISAALGMATAAKLEGKDEKIIAVIGDGSMTGGLAFEALNHAGSLKTDILVILNDNQISIDDNIGALHKYLVKISTSPTYNRVKNYIWEKTGATRLRTSLKKFVFSTKMAFLKSGSLFESLGFRYFGTIDGNDIGQLVSTLESLKNIHGPKLLHIRTIKGKGYKPAEMDQTVWHAPGTFDPVTGERTSKPDGKRAKYQEVFGETLLQLARSNDKIVGITPAMATGCSMNILMKEMPERVFDVGIAEQHAVTFSAGLAAEGMIPFCNIYSSFMQRAYDNVIHDVALQKLKVIFCLDRAGLVGEDGATHHGAFDLACFRPIPNLTIFAPMNEIELRNIMYSATLPEYGTTIIRYPRGNGEGVSWRDVEFSKIPYGKAEKLHDGEKIALLTIGTVGNKAAQAVKRAEEENKMNVLHYNMRFLKPLDTDTLKDVCSKVDKIITVEDGAITGGLHSAVAEYISNHCSNIKFIGLGIPDRFIEQGSLNELHKECGYSTDEIYQKLF